MRPHSAIPSALAFAVCALAAIRADAPGRVLAYDLRPGQPLRYKMSAKVKASMPLFDSPTPVDIDADINMVYVASPKTLLADGTSDVDFRVESFEVLLNKFPFPIALEDVQNAFNQSVIMDRTGSIKKVNGGGTLPFNISLPGFDPTRLYSLIFPVVFRTSAVRPGDTWSFKSELLGGQNAKPAFTATVLKPDGGAIGSTTQLKETVRLDVNQRLNEKKQPVTVGQPAHRTRKGSIEGEGLLDFDSQAGRFSKSIVKLHANVQDDLLGKPENPDDPKQVVSKVDATVTVEYESPEMAKSAAAAKAAEAAKAAAESGKKGSQ